MVKYREEEWLRREYIERERSAREIARGEDFSHETVRRWARKFGFARSASEAAELRSRKYPNNLDGNRERSIHPAVFTRRRGYEYAACGTNKEQVALHRLLATLLVDDLAALDGMDVHHRNNIPWDNRLENLEVLTPEEHGRVTRERA